MPDPVFQVRLRYTDAQSGMTWTIVNHRIAVDAAALFAVADVWNTAYLKVCAETVSIVDMRVSDVAVTYDMHVFEQTSFTDKVGQEAGVPTEISSYAKWTGFGSPLFRGQSAWKFHGISDTFVSGSKLDTLNADIQALSVASNVYMRQYRAVDGENVPACPVPTSFASYTINGLYSRRLGRSFLSPGQQRRYTRTAPAV